MIIFPAIDIKDEKCVRLSQGKFDNVDVYGDDPSEMAMKWEAFGAEFIHVVDLDGAKDGTPKNSSLIEKIVSRVHIPIQLGGGIRSYDTVKLLLEKGVRRVILGTSAVKSPELVEKLVAEFGDRIAIGIDAKDGFVAIEGWASTSSFTAIEFAQKMQDIGVKTIIYTDISKDGMMIGPNFDAMQKMMEAVPSINIIASGGVSSIEDVRKLSEMGVYGAIIGKAAYIGKIDIKEAIRVGAGSRPARDGGEEC